METEKTGPNDGSYDGVYDEDEQDEKEKNLGKDRKYNEELKKLEEAGKQVKERRKEGLKQYEKKEIDAKKQVREKEKEIKIGGQKVKAKKKFSHKKAEGIFIRGKSTNYSNKIDKALRKVHGVSLKKKKEAGEIIKSCILRNTVATEKEINNAISKFRHKKFTGSGSGGVNKMLKNKKKEGVNIKKYKEELNRKFSKRDWDKIKRAFGGKEDPLKHKIKSSSNRNPGMGKPGSTSPSKIRNRF